MRQTAISMKKLPTRSREQNPQSVTPRARTVGLRLAAKWFEYIDAKVAPSPSNIDYWIALANNPPGTKPTFNFDIRDYRFVPSDEAERVIDNVRGVLASLARLPPSAGYEPFEHHPFRLF